MVKNYYHLLLHEPKLLKIIVKNCKNNVASATT